MSAPANNDCYLCGSPNEPEASHCERCSGQLLRLPSEEPAPASDPTEDLRNDDLAPEEEEEEEEVDKPRRKRRTRKGNIADQRLSDALGLDQTIVVANDDTHNDDLVDTVVTSIPRATPAADIPLIGTRAGAVPQSALNERTTGKATFVLLGLLVAATGWLGYSTLTASSEGPENIAFTATTTTSSSSTTSTEPPKDLWTLSEVNGRYAQVFLRVDLYDCTTPDEPSMVAENVVGVALDTNHVLIENLPALGSADVAVVKTRTFTRRTVKLSRMGDGALIGTSRTQTSRNLGIDSLTSPIEGDQTFFVGFDRETNEVATTTRRVAAPVEIGVSETGVPNAIFFGTRTHEIDSLLGVSDIELEIDPEVELRRRPNECETISAWRDVGAPQSTSTEPTELDETLPE